MSQLTSADLADRLGVSTNTISRWRRNGTLPPPATGARKRGVLWDRRDIERWQKAGHTTSVSRFVGDLAAITTFEDRLRSVEKRNPNEAVKAYARAIRELLSNINVPLATRKQLTAETTGEPWLRQALSDPETYAIVRKTVAIMEFSRSVRAKLKGVRRVNSFEQFAELLLRQTFSADGWDEIARVLGNIAERAKDPETKAALERVVSDAGSLRVDDERLKDSAVRAAKEILTPLSSEEQAAMAAFMSRTAEEYAAKLLGLLQAVDSN